jgi:hypothetical protein
MRHGKREAGRCWLVSRFTLQGFARHRAGRDAAAVCEDPIQCGTMFFTTKSRTPVVGRIA